MAQRQYADERKEVLIQTQAICLDCDWKSYSYSNSGDFKPTDNVRKCLLRHLRERRHRGIIQTQRTVHYACQ